MSHWVEEDDALKAGSLGILTVHFQLPENVASAADVELLFDGAGGVGALLLKVPGQAVLRAPLAHTVDDASMRAGFRKKTRVLSVKVTVTQCGTRKPAKSIAVIEDEDDDEAPAPPHAQPPKNIPPSAPPAKSGQPPEAPKRNPLMAMSLEGEEGSSSSAEEEEEGEEGDDAINKREDDHSGNVGRVSDLLKKMHTTGATSATSSKDEQAVFEGAKATLDMLKSSLPHPTSIRNEESIKNEEAITHATSTDMLAKLLPRAPDPASIRTAPRNPAAPDILQHLKSLIPDHAPTPPPSSTPSSGPPLEDRAHMLESLKAAIPARASEQASEQEEAYEENLRQLTSAIAQARDVSGEDAARGISEVHSFPAEPLAIPAEPAPASAY
ncbi:hypothetical protein T484DRAFT_1935643, partial [Baffinella frigidus]